MPRNILLAILLISVFYDIKAQEKDKPFLIPVQKGRDTLTRYTWEVGTDLLWLIDKNTLPATNIFIRKNIVTKNKRLAAIRLRFGLDLNKVDSSQIGNANPVERFRISPFIRIGYEWQKQLNKFQLFYGVELHFLYLYNFERDEAAFSNSFGEGKVNFFQVGPIGFLGLKYFLNSRVSISTQAGYQVFYERYKFQGKSKGANSEINRTEIAASFNPIYFININYYF